MRSLNLAVAAGIGVYTALHGLGGGPGKMGWSMSILTDPGDLAETPLAAILLEALNTRSSGVLEVAHGGGTSRLWFRDGRPVGAQVFAGFKPLGMMLLQAGLIDIDALSRSLALMAEKRRPQGELLVELGAVSAADVARVLAEQQAGYFGMIAALDAGRFAFEGSTPVPEWTRGARLSPVRTIVDALERPQANALVASALQPVAARGVRLSSGYPEIAEAFHWTEVERGLVARLERPSRSRLVRDVAGAAGARAGDPRGAAPARGGEAGPGGAGGGADRRDRAQPRRAHRDPSARRGERVPDAEAGREADLNLDVDVDGEADRDRDRDRDCDCDCDPDPDPDRDRDPDRDPDRRSRPPLAEAARGTAERSCRGARQAPAPPPAGDEEHGRRPVRRGAGRFRADHAGAHPSADGADGDPGSQARRRVGGSLREALLAAAPRVKEKDLFVRLGLPETAGRDDVKKAFLGLAKQFHPDRFASPALADLQDVVKDFFASVNEAYEVLSDDKKRTAYLEKRKGGGAVRSESAKVDFQKGEACLRTRDFARARGFLESAVRAEPTPAYQAALAWAYVSDPVNKDRERPRALPSWKRRRIPPANRAFSVAGIIARDGAITPRRSGTSRAADEGEPARNSDAVRELAEPQEPPRREPQVTGPRERKRS